MACKEVMVTAPVVILLFERTFVSGSFLKALRKSWPLYLALALGWLVLLALNFNAPRSRTAGFHLKVPPHVWWFTQAQVLWMYLKLVVWPWPLVIHYAPDYLDTLSAAWPWLLGAIVLAIACTFLFWRRYAAGFVGIAVLAVLSPTLVVPIVTEVAAERRMYLPLSAITALAVIGVYWLVQAWQARASRGPGRGTLGQSATIKAAVIGAAAVAVVLGLVSYARVAVMRDPVRLWSEAALYEPNDSLAHTNLGMELFRVNRVQDAIEQYREALRLNPGEPTALVNLAVALVVVGRPQDAIAPCEEAIRSHSDYAKAHSTLGVALAETGKPEAARDEYLEAIRLNPDDAETHCNLGLLLAGAGKPQEAIKQYQESLRLRPNYPKARYSLGVALMETGQVAEAVEQFVFTLRLKPDYVEAGANLAVAYAQLNRTPKAIRVAERTLNMARTQKQAAVEQQMIKLLAELQAKRRAGGAGE
jgi:tetratricopeptide (TPR) repeat protein